MPLHIIIVGVTGLGKTTSARTLQKAVYDYNQLNPDKVKSVIAFDRKANDYGDLPKLFSCIHYKIPDTLRLSLEAPPGVPPNEWINIISTLFCARTKLQAGWVTVANTLRWLLPESYKSSLRHSYTMHLCLNTNMSPSISFSNIWGIFRQPHNCQSSKNLKSKN